VRLFVAVDPPPVALDDLAAVVDLLAVSAAGARVTARPLWHVTLAFIGEVPDDQVPAATAALDAAVRDAPGVPLLRIRGGGRFGRGKMTILWAGVDGELRPLRRAVTRQLKAARLPFDAKRFHPHLTLARPGERLPPEDLRRDLAVLGGYEGPQWTVEAIRLVRSQLGPKPSYDTMHVARVG
jgi:RNA 2',3'-cyclic 3'-phosphodiesterase